MQGEAFTSKCQETFNETHWPTLLPLAFCHFICFWSSFIDCRKLYRCLIWKNYCKKYEEQANRFSYTYKPSGGFRAVCITATGLAGVWNSGKLHCCTIKILSSAEFGLETLNPLATTAQYKLHIVKHRKYQKLKILQSSESNNAYASLKLWKVIWIFVKTRVVGGLKSSRIKLKSNLRDREKTLNWIRCKWLQKMKNQTKKKSFFQHGHLAFGEV